MNTHSKNATKRDDIPSLEAVVCFCNILTFPMFSPCCWRMLVVLRGVYAPSSSKLTTDLTCYTYIYILVLLLFAARISKRKSVCSFFCLPTFGCVVSRCKTYCKCLNKNIQFPWFHLSFNLIFSLREESHPPTRWAQKRLYSNIPITNGRK